MGPVARTVIAALLGIGALGFFSVLWVLPAYYKFIPPRVTLAIRALYCAIGCGYLVLAYVVLQGVPSMTALSLVLMTCSTLNLNVLAVERPWTRLAPPRT